MANGLVNGTFKKDRPPTQGPVVGRVKREYRYYKALLDDPRTPTTAKWLIGGGVGYLMLPFDLIPDFIPVIGKLDDMLITTALIGLGVKLVPEDVKNEDRSRSRRIRRICGHNSVGAVLFESKALPGPFGIKIDTCGRDAEIQGPVLFPLLDLMFEYGLVVVTDSSSTGDRLDVYTIENAMKGCAGRCSTQIELDVKFRPLPLVAAVMYHGSNVDECETFINLESAYTALPAALSRKLSQLRLRWEPCNEICVDAVLRSDETSTVSQEGAVALPGAQFMNLLMSNECNVVEPEGKSAKEIYIQLREHMLKETFCYRHQPSPASELIAWNPRKIRHVPAENSNNEPHYIYPCDLDGTELGH
ncbi:MAG: DUF1232 domain-containing protein [Gammaproteobacteria bacterium]|nr:DUF1232 domain-containing protein [Gammaproteobacteria bacterium]NNL51119.1 DUF1232 domain-containing protein [Woeseiaceae bacterium]